MATQALRITKKGQVTIPKTIREKLRATAVYLGVDKPIKVYDAYDARSEIENGL